jgi:hypothetical protein
MRFEYNDVIDIVARIMGTYPEAPSSIWNTLARLRVHFGEIRAIGVYDLSAYLEVSWLRAALPPAPTATGADRYDAVESALTGSGGLAVEF